MATAKLPKPDLASLDPLVALIIASLPGPTDAQKDGVGVGEHPLDLDIRIRVRGELRVGQSSEVKQVNKLKPWTLVRLLADRCSAAALQECLDTAIAASRAASANSPAVLAMEAEGDDLKARVEAAMEQAGESVTIVRRGSVLLLGDVSVQVED